MSSDAHYKAPGIDFEALRRPARGITGLREYAVSKLCNVLFSQELARRTEGTGVRSYALHPGVVASDIWRRVPWPVRPLMTRHMLPVDEGAATSLYCATSPAVAGDSGLFYDKCAPREASAVATPELGRELWERSEAWTAPLPGMIVACCGSYATSGRGMDLPVNPPVAPMLAKPVEAIPDGDYVFEPKWDGFRSIVFRDGDEVEIGSRNERPMTRYFPELVAAIRAELPERCVIDGEIVVPDASGRRLDFEALQLRIHPAASRVALLAEQTPAHFIAFDLLALGSETTWSGRSPSAGRRWRACWPGRARPST